MDSKNIYIVGSASGMAASQPGCADGPVVLKDSPYMQNLSKVGLDLHWQAILQPSKDNQKPTLEQVVNHNTSLANAVASLVEQNKFFTVYGGDHSCAIGTWSGAVSAKSSEGDLGLLWIDAHMDSHTPGTSETGNIHGMPLACLLGYGEPLLTTIAGPAPKFKPENVCLVGVRSFEQGEARLLESLNVRIYFIDEVKRRGLETVMAEAYGIINRGTVGFGVTLDIDSIDPADAPGTGVAEPNGLSAKELTDVLTRFAGEAKFVGMEIVEFDPHLDKNQSTERLVAKLTAALAIGEVIDP